MYRYETHMHTSPVSRCAEATVEETLTFYKELGYAGVFLTNHFLDGNLNIERDRPYEERLEFYFSDYDKALEVGKTLDLPVFLGVELSYRGTDFLVYGLDKEWYFAHPEIMEIKKSQELSMMMDAGALIIQAHPFRESPWIDHVRLFPKQVHGVEIRNSNRPKEENRMAKLYADHYGLLEFAGTDNHKGPAQKRLAGMCCQEPVKDVQDFIAKVKSKEASVFMLTLE